MDNEQIRALVVGIVGLIVLLVSAFVPQLAEQLRLIQDGVVAIVLIILGIPAAVKTLNAYFAMRVQTAQIQAVAAQAARNTSRE